MSERGFGKRHEATRRRSRASTTRASRTAAPHSKPNRARRPTSRHAWPKPTAFRCWSPSWTVRSLAGRASAAIALAPATPASPSSPSTSIGASAVEVSAGSCWRRSSRAPASAATGSSSRASSPRTPPAARSAARAAFVRSGCTETCRARRPMDGRRHRRALDSGKHDSRLAGAGSTAEELQCRCRHFPSSSSVRARSDCLPPRTSSPGRSPRSCSKPAHALATAFGDGDTFACFRRGR